MRGMRDTSGMVGRAKGKTAAASRRTRGLAPKKGRARGGGADERGCFRRVEGCASKRRAPGARPHARVCRHVGHDPGGAPPNPPSQPRRKAPPTPRRRRRLGAAPRFQGLHRVSPPARRVLGRGSRGRGSRRARRASRGARRPAVQASVGLVARQLAQLPHRQLILRGVRGGERVKPGSGVQYPGARRRAQACNRHARKEVRGQALRPEDASAGLSRTVGPIPARKRRRCRGVAAVNGPGIARGARATSHLGLGHDPGLGNGCPDGLRLAGPRDVQAPSGRQRGVHDVDAVAGSLPARTQQGGCWLGFGGVAHGKGNWHVRRSLHSQPSSPTGCPVGASAGAPHTLPTAGNPCTPHHVDDQSQTGGQQTPAFAGDGEQVLVPRRRVQRQRPGDQQRQPNVVGAVAAGRRAGHETPGRVQDGRGGAERGQKHPPHSPLHPAPGRRGVLAVGSPGARRSSPGPALHGPAGDSSPHGGQYLFSLTMRYPCETPGTRDRTMRPGPCSDSGQCTTGLGVISAAVMTPALATSTAALRALHHHAQL